VLFKLSVLSRTVNAKLIAVLRAILSTLFLALFGLLLLQIYQRVSPLLILILRSVCVD